MDYQEFNQLVAQNRIPSVLFFEGPEEYLKESALKALRRRLLPEGMEDLNETRLTAPEPDEIIAAAETLPFLADRRLVFLRDYPAIVGRAEADEKLLSYLPSVPPTTVLLFYCVLPVKQKKIKNAVQKLGGLVQFASLKEKDLTSFVTRAFHDLDRECDARTADYLIFTCGTDLNLLLREVEKIALLHPEAVKVDPADVQALATPSTESRVFQMVDAVVAGEDTKAFASLRNLLLNGESRIGILYMLTRQFRIMQQIKIMQYEKKPTAEIFSALGLSSWVGQQYLHQSKSYTGRQVKEAVQLCLDTDYQIKSGRLREDGALETVILKLLLLRKV